jgi:hypothetical protein
VVIHVPRGGEKGKIPLHGTVLLCLEMIILSVASTEPQRTIKSMKRINELHRGLKPGKKSSTDRIRSVWPRFYPGWRASLKNLIVLVGIAVRFWRCAQGIAGFHRSRWLHLWHRSR